MYQCQLCKKRFSETQGTVFFGLKTPAQTVYRALASLAEGQGVRSVARVFEVDKDTVQEWLRKAGEHSEQVSDYLMHGLHLSEAQLDELWSFVYKKEKNLTPWEELYTEYGDTWVWTVFDPVYKLVVAHVVGEQKRPEAKALLTKLKSRLAEGVVPLFTSDQLVHYVDAILETFGHLVQPERKGSRGRFPKPRWVAGPNLCYATVVKEREKGRVVSVTTRIIFGTARKVWARIKASPVSRVINTSFVERMNGTLRHLTSRLHRKTLCFSKKREYLEYHLELVIAYYHFVLPHKSLRRRLPQPIPTRGNGSPKKWAPCTPAMAAGLTDHVWSMKELLSFRVPPQAATT